MRLRKRKVAPRPKRETPTLEARPRNRGSLKKGDAERATTMLQDVAPLAASAEMTQATPTPEEYVNAADSEGDYELPHAASPTAVALEAMASGVFPDAPLLDEIPGEDQGLRAGDPDIDPLENEFSGEEVPGASMPTPDQTNVDDTGRAYGLSDTDNGALVLGAELLERRDARRWELDPSSKGPEEK